MKREVTDIPVDRIRVVNPRIRDKRKFATVVESIRNLGLKKPIQVSPRPVVKGEPPAYDLICGQGRVEAFQQLGYEFIPAIVMEATKEDRLLMSLVENLARCFASPLELVDEITRLKGCGYSNVAISKKLDISDTAVSQLCTLARAGEGRLINEVISGKLPLAVAFDISTVENPAQQKLFIEAYEKKQLNHAAIRTVKRVMMQRNLFGKKLEGKPKASKYTSAEGLVNTFKKESQRQKLLVRKTKLCEARLMFITEAMRRVMADEDFVNLLKAEKIDTMPKELSDCISNS